MIEPKEGGIACEVKPPFLLDKNNLFPLGGWLPDRFPAPKRDKNSMRTAIYMRVSKNDESQNPQNQREPLLKLAQSLGLEVVEEYIDMASGGNSNRPQFQKMLQNAKERKFDKILVWSLDRFSREGMSNTLHYLEKLSRSGIGLKSLQESWLDTSDKGMGQLLIAIMSWVAQQERIRISERTKAGLAYVKLNGRTLGRPKGARDKVRRKKSGYLLRWQNKTI